MNYLLGSIITLSAFLLGYWLGYGKLKLEATPEITKAIDRALGRDAKPGIINRPTQKDLEDRRNPKIAEGKKEFGRLLNELDLNK